MTDPLKRTIASLETEYGKIQVSVSKTDMTISDLWEEVLEPMLLGAGYSKEMIDNLFEDK